MSACAPTAATCRRGWTVIDDIIDIMSSGEWMDTAEIVAALVARDRVRYRTATRQYIPPMIRTLESQGYRFEVDKEYYSGARQRVRYRLVE